MVDVAQLVEPRIVIPVVAGSIPVVHPIFIFENQYLADDLLVKAAMKPVYNRYFFDSKKLPRKIS